jgi:hypothetical protein
MALGRVTVHGRAGHPRRSIVVVAGSCGKESMKYASRSVSDGDITK